VINYRQHWRKKYPTRLWRIKKAKSKKHHITRLH